MAHTKRNHNCPECGVDFWEKTVGFINGVLVPVWECPNCSHMDARRVNKKGSHITPAQRKAADAAVAFHMKGRDPEKYEVINRAENLSERGGLVLQFTIRFKTPGTLGYAFPDTYLLFIGRAGGYSNNKYDDIAKKTVFRTGFDALNYARI